MKYLVFLLVLVTATAFAGGTTENPHQEFDISKVNSDNIQIELVRTHNVQKTCNAESKKRGYKGFPYAVEACSFWSGSPVNNKCTIVLDMKVNYHTIGHEMRHCLQGEFHK